MKNNLFKKSLALVMTVMMLMTCWVFIPATHEHFEADAAFANATKAYNEAMLNEINTNVDYNVNTTGNYYKFLIYGNGDNGNDNTTERQQKYYKNILVHSGDLQGDQNLGSYFTNVTNSELTVSIVYPSMVLKYDGQTTPKFGIMLEADAAKNKTIRFERAWMDANSNGLSFNPNYWLGIANDDSAYFYCMDVADHKYTLRAQDTNQGGVFNSRKNGQWEFLAASLEFTGSMSMGEWTRTISPTWKFSNGSTTYTGTNVSTIYVMNFKSYGELLTRINNHKNELLANAAQYTPESIRAFVNAAKNIINCNPKNYTSTVSQAPTWGSNMTTYYNAYNTAVNGLTRRQFEVTYDNMFSLADWRYSASAEKSGVSVDLNAGKVTVQHPNASGEYVTTHSGSSSNSGTRNTNHYAMPVIGGQEYTMKYTTDGSYTEMFAFFYDANGGCTHESSYGAYNFSVADGTGERTVKAPDGSAYMEIRFDNNTPNTTANFWDIMIYPAAVKTENEVDTWTARPHRQIYAYNASVGTLQTPVRPGYIFNGWKEDTDGDGVGDAAAPTGAITSTRVLYSTWTPGTMDVGYDNLFSLSAWANSKSNGKGNTANTSNIVVDLDAGTIAVTGKSDAYTTYGGGSDQYHVAVTAGETYIFDYDVTSTNGTYQAFVFFYNDAGSGVTGAIYNGSAQSNAHIGLYNGQPITFTVPEGCTKVGFRVGICGDAEGTATYSNIGVYKKADYDAYAKDYAKVREPFIIGDTDLLMIPTRAGYVFEGWELEDGTKITSVEGLKANTTVYASWTKEHTVTYYYGDNTTVLATVKVKDGETVGSLPTVTPTKETTAEYSYSFKNWTANDTTFTASTKVTSDLKVYPVFDNVPHTFVWAANPYKNATCDAPALVGKSCSGCGYSLGNVPYDGDNANWLAKGHDYSRGEILENSSTGNTDTDTHSIKCARYSTCGSVQLVKHTWTGDTSVGATCTTPGTVKKTCPCGAEKFVEGALDKTNHVNTKLVNVVTPDCENDGFTGDLVCADCGVTIAFGKTDPKLGHSFTKYLTDGNATCTADGTETAQCERCDVTDTRTVEGSKLDHTFTNYVYNNDAKCGVDGTKTAECDTCDTGATDTITAEGTALTHNFNGEIKNNNDGTHSYKCTNEGCDVYGGTTDCTYGEWDTTDSSQHIKTCEDCGYKLKENHKFSAWATTDEYKQADGQHSRTCLVCHKEVIKDCTYTRTEHAETCTADGYIVHSCNDCGHKYQTVATGKIGHNYSGEIKSYNNGQHNYLCVNGCGTYGYSGVENARVNCSFDYENTADGSHKATCAYCKYSTTEACSGGQATCTAKAECTKCNTVYGETVPHSFTGTVVKLDGDKHAYLCEFCSTEGLYGVGAEKDATESCSGGTATCKDLAVCDKCNDTYGDYAAHVFNGFVIQLDNDVHAFRCSVCKDNSLYGIGNEVNKTEACSGGTATCIKPALCDVCSGYHGEVDENAHVWREWAHVEGTETHKRVCDLNPGEHIETVACQAATQEVVEPDCEAQGYTVNTCGTCGHEWKSDYVDALDHQWGAWEKGSAGWHQRTCEREGCTYGENGTAKVEESLCMYLQEVKEVVEPTCTEEGYTTYRCTGCGYEWNSFPVPATGHHFTKQTKKTDSKYQRSTKDCVTDWTYWYCCDDCDVSAETEKDNYENEADLYWVREAAAGHKYDAKTATEDYLATVATCTEKATYYYSCSVCKASSKGTANEKTFEHGSALNHDWQDTETYLKSEADCINNEVYYKECSRCHISSENETGATWEKADTKSGHDFDHDNDDVLGNEGDAGYTKGVAATCTEDGVVEHYTCDVCKKHFKADMTTEIAADKLTIAALKHDFKDVAAKAATCEEDGYTKHKQCQREDCGYRNTDYKVIPALGHEYKAENGYYTDKENNKHAFYCTNNCGTYGIDNVKNATVDCVFDGEYEQYDDENGIHSHKKACVCGNEQSAACADAEPVHVLPTCTEDGYYIHTCDTCGYKWTVASDAEEDKKLNHKLVIVPNNNGTHSAKCERENCDYAEAAEKCSTATPATECGKYDICDICNTAFGEAKPHVFTNYVYNNDAKCGVDGTKTAECDTCDTGATHTITAEGTALQHVMVVFEDADSLEYKTSGVWYYNNEFGYSLDKWLGMPADFDTESIYRPTCSEDGIAISYCTRVGCDHYITKAASKIDDGHIWGEEKSVGGNCATGVTFRKECTVCGKATTRVEAVEHSYEIMVSIPATCEAAKYEYSICSVCGDDKEEYIGEKLGHNWDTVVVDKEATCGQTGRQYSICSRCNAASEIEELPRLGHVWDAEGFTPDMLEYDDGIYVAAVDSTCQYEGHAGYYKCLKCSYDQHLDEEWKKNNIIPKKDHEDNDNDGKCDGCNSKLYGEDNNKNCDCICHKENWFSKIIYKILCFFWRLFGIGKSCDCGTVHY